MQEKLLNARCRLLVLDQFYGSFAIQMKWIECERVQTMGVRIVGDSLECLWSPSFVASMSIMELCAVIQHEIEHVIRMHCLRDEGYIHEIMNIATDCCINGKHSAPNIGYCDQHGQRILPDLGVGKSIIWLPEDWPSGETCEYYYNKLIRSTRQISGQTLDNHDIWSESTATPEQAREIVKITTDNSAAHGNIPGHLIDAINNLQQPYNDPLRIIRNIIGRSLGNRRLSYSRRNRRFNQFGMPGNTRKSAAHVCIVIDVSGSITNFMLGRFFGTVESSTNHAVVSLVQWDAELQHYTPNYRAGDWRSIPINGRGGTDMGTAIDWVANNRMAGDLCILLTDGQTPWPSRKPINLLTVIANTKKSVPGPTWGHTVWVG